MLVMTTWLSEIAAAELVPDVTGEQQFQEQVQPLLAKYCFDCHGNDVSEGDLTLDTFKSAGEILPEQETWQKVIQKLQVEAMPPEGVEQPSAEERQFLIQWVEETLAAIDCVREARPGRTTIRRLNRYEYRNTIRDWLDVDYQATADFPADDVGYGFDNIGDVLSLPPSLLEKYFAAAEAIAGLSTKNLPDVSNFAGFIGQLPTEPPPEVVPDPPADSDQDGLTDEEEVALGTDPNKADTDGDGDGDKAEVDADTDPKDPASNSNRSPTQLLAGFLSVRENKPAGTPVGDFNATDPDANASLAFSLADGNGSTHNHLFQLDANGTLKTAAVLDREANATLAIRVRVTDERNGTLEKPFTFWQF